jgi:hypothetical protein
MWMSSHTHAIDRATQNRRLEHRDTQKIRLCVVRSTICLTLGSVVR